ncbi:hypothetical protein [Streptomyces fructofermentans]|nr:hypothetical protein [Streptomyces fructofermentans]
MTSGRRTLTALHLLLVWAVTAVAVPTLGLGLVMSAWGGGGVGAAPVLLLGVPLTVGLLATAGIPARTVVPLCDSVGRRLGWAVLVLLLGTLGVVAGVAAYGGDVDLGSAATRIALTGAPYAVAAAFFVPSGWVRAGAVVVLAAAVVYGGAVGPEHARQRRHAAEVAGFREHPELLRLGDPPSGMRVAHAWVGPADFGVDYRGVREDEFAYVGLTVRSPLTPAARCPEPAEEDMTCTVGARGELCMVRELRGGVREITLVRRDRNAEVQVESQTLGEAGLRRVLDTLHPLSDGELAELMREDRIDHRP